MNIWAKKFQRLAAERRAATLGSLELDACEEHCATCHGRIPEGEEIPEDVALSSWGPRLFCSEECKAQHDIIRL